MSNANTIFTRTRFGLDTRVWLMMLLILFLSLFLLSFRMATRVVCSDYSITPEAITAGKTNSFYTGEPIVFSASVSTSDNLVWDFNDGSKPVSGNHIKHFFLHDGNYTVSSTVNGSCIQVLVINIKEFASKAAVVITPVSLENIITGADTPHVGEKAVYAATQKADQYEWSVLNAPEYPTITDSVASYKFEIPGSRIIVLKINGDDKKIFKKNIVVMQPLIQKTTLPTTTTTHSIPSMPVNLPPKITSVNPASGSTGTTVTIIGSNFTGVTAVSFGGTQAASFLFLSPTAISATIGTGGTGNVSVTTRNGVAVLTTQSFIYNAPSSSSSTATQLPPKNKIIVIPDEEFKHMFQQVCDGQKDVSGFNAYLCKGDQTIVLANNDWMSLGEFCKKLKEKKKGILGRKEYKINSVKVTRDVANQNCVTNLTVDYK